MDGRTGTARPVDVTAGLSCLRLRPTAGSLAWRAGLLGCIGQAGYWLSSEQYFYLQTAKIGSYEY